MILIDSFICIKKIYTFKRIYSGFVDVDKIVPYEQNREKFIAKGRTLDFKNAVTQIDEYISDPMVQTFKFLFGITFHFDDNFLQIFRSHAFVKPAMKKVPIKTERDIERRLKVKTEPCRSVRAAQNEFRATQSFPNIWKKEKQILVDKIVALKAENHQYLLRQKKTQAEYDAVLLTKQKLDRTISENEATFSMQLRELQLKLLKTENELSEIKSNNEKIISDLKREKQMLLAQVSQYKTGMEQKSCFENQKNRSEIVNQTYEVEAILKHRDTASGRKYLIRWKGYGSGDDTWENEANLSSPKMLNKYIRSMGLSKK